MAAYGEPEPEPAAPGSYMEPAFTHLIVEKPVQRADRKRRDNLASLRTSRTRMMLCKPNGSPKHLRWFWLGEEPLPTTKLCWSKSEEGAIVKGKC